MHTYIHGSHSPYKKDTWEMNGIRYVLVDMSDEIKQNDPLLQFQQKIGSGLIHTSCKT